MSKNKDFKSCMEEISSFMKDKEILHDKCGGKLIMSNKADKRVFICNKCQNSVVFNDLGTIKNTVEEQEANKK